jgi:hypothetical protein
MKWLAYGNRCQFVIDRRVLSTMQLPPREGLNPLASQSEFVHFM